MRLRRSLLSLIPIACFLGLFAYSLTQLISIDRSFREEIGESNLWASTQADREAQTLMLAIYRLDRIPDIENVLLRFEILYSRIALMLERPQIDYFRSIGVENDVTQAKQALKNLDLEFSTPGIDARAILGQIPQVEALSDILRSITNATALEERIARHTRREAQLNIMQLLLLAVGGLFVTGVIMAALQWRSMQRLLAARAELHKHLDTLEDTVSLRTKELRNALDIERRAKEVYRSFIVTVSHQFRTPVSIIHMIAQRQLRSSDDLSESLRRKFSRIFDAAERLERLLSGFLASASLDGNEVTLSRRTLDLNEVLQISVEQTNEANPGRSIEIDLAPEPLRINADPVLLEQVILNLLSNAMKYSQAPEIVSLSSWQEAGKIYCRVTDRGLGISESEKHAIFDRFYRAPNAHRLPGVGVGLSLVRDIVSLHGGEVTFTSRLGEGSEFTVALPALGDSADELGTTGRNDTVHRR